MTYVNWLERFRLFFENKENQERLGVVASASGVRELWLQGELYHWFNKVKRPESNSSFFVNKNIGKVRPDLVFGEWDYNTKHWRNKEMAAEIKFLGYNYKPKMVYGAPDLEEFFENEQPKKTLMQIDRVRAEKLLNASINAKGRSKNNLVKDYSRLLNLVKLVPECYLILICSTLKSKESLRMYDALEGIEFEKPVKWLVETGKPIKSNEINCNYPIKFKVKIWRITDASFQGARVS